MSVYVTAILVCVALVVGVAFLLRTRRIREKYAAIWILLTLAVVIVALFPEVAFVLARLVGVQTPVNLVFALAIVVLLAVGIQLSTEVSSLEEETRTLAEEVALLRLDVRRLGVPTDTPRANARPTADDPAGPWDSGPAHEPPAPTDAVGDEAP